MEHNNDRGERREKAQTVRRNSLEKNTLYNTAGSLFYLFCQWLLTLIVVHAGGYEDAGNFSLAMSNTNVLFTLATFGLQHYVISDRNNEFTPSEYLSTRLSTAAAAVVICAAVTLLNGRYTAEQKTCIILYMLYRAAEALIDMLQAFEYRAERMDYAFVSFILRGLGILAGFTLLLRFAGSLPLAILALAAVSFGVALGYDRRMCARLEDIHACFSARRSAALLSRTWMLMCNSLLTAAIVSFPRSALERICGSYDLGIYASVATPAVIVQSAALWLYAPAIVSLTDSWNRKDLASYRRLELRVWLILAGLFLLAFAAAALLGPWGLTLLFGAEIRPYAGLLLPVLAGTALIAASYYASTLLTIARRLPDILIANASATLLMLLLKDRLIAAEGMNGVNLVIIASMALNALIMLLLNARAVRLHFKN